MKSRMYTEVSYKMKKMYDINKVTQIADRVNVRANTFVKSVD